MCVVLSSETSEEQHEYDQYLQQVRAVVEYRGNDWYRVYLLRALHRQAGRDRILGLMSDPAWAWLFPPEVLRIQVNLPPPPPHLSSLRCVSNSAGERYPDLF